MSWLSELWRKRKVKDRIAEELKKEAGSFKTQFYQKLVRGGFDTKMANDIADQAYRLLVEMIDKVF